jgi:hypothetical protein
VGSECKKKAVGLFLEVCRWSNKHAGSVCRRPFLLWFCKVFVMHISMSGTTYSSHGAHGTTVLDISKFASLQDGGVGPTALTATVCMNGNMYVLIGSGSDSIISVLEGLNGDVYRVCIDGSMNVSFSKEKMFV